MPERMKPYLPTAFLALLIIYFGIQSLTGQRGLLTGADREAMLERRTAQLEQLRAQRSDLEARALYLRTDNLSRDLLEERARVVLGFADPRDYVIRLERTTAS